MAPGLSRASRAAPRQPASSPSAAATRRGSRWKVSRSCSAAAQRVEQPVAGLGQTAADHDRRHVEERLAGGEPVGERLDRLPPDLGRPAARRPRPAPATSAAVGRRRRPARAYRRPTRRPRRPPPGSRAGRSRSAGRRGVPGCGRSPRRRRARRRRPTRRPRGRRRCRCRSRRRARARCPRPAPSRASARPPARTSWPSAVGRPSRVAARSRSGTSRKPTFADQTATPRASSTTPGTAMPAATGVRPVGAGRFGQALGDVEDVATTASGPRSGPVGCRSVCSTRPCGWTRAHFMPVPPTSSATRSLRRSCRAHREGLRHGNLLAIGAPCAIPLVRRLSRVILRELVDGGNLTRGPPAQCFCVRPVSRTTVHAINHRPCSGGPRGPVRAMERAARAAHRQRPGQRRGRRRAARTSPRPPSGVTSTSSPSSR